MIWMKGRWKWICLAAAVILAASGMCFAGAQADSLLECHKTTPLASRMVSGDFENRVVMSAEEISGLRSVSTILFRTRLILEKSGVKAGSVLVLLAYLLADLFFLTGSRWPDDLENAYGRRVIVRYIHNQDGRKG